MGFQKQVITGAPPCMGVYLKIWGPSNQLENYQRENVGKLMDCGTHIFGTPHTKNFTHFKRHHDEMMERKSLGNCSGLPKIRVIKMVILRATPPVRPHNFLGILKEYIFRPPLNFTCNWEDQQGY